MAGASGVIPRGDDVSGGPGRGHGFHPSRVVVGVADRIGLGTGDGLNGAIGVVGGDGDVCVVIVPGNIAVTVLCQVILQFCLILHLLAIYRAASWFPLSGR